MKVKNCLIAVLVALGLLALDNSGVYAKKHLEEKRERKVRSANKKVSATTGPFQCDGDSFCLFETNAHSWCFVPKTPLLTLGWETD